VEPDVESDVDDAVLLTSSDSEADSEDDDDDDDKDMTAEVKTEVTSHSSDSISAVCTTADNSDVIDIDKVANISISEEHTSTAACGLCLKHF